jgi:hypothetical protein
MWARIRQWFHDSETIFWARLQMFVGVVWTTLVSVDLAPLLPAKYLTVWLVISGVVTELARRSRAVDLR